jgi:integrase
VTRLYGTGTIYRRGRVWWISYRLGGQRYAESAKSTKKVVAIDLLKKRLGQIGQGHAVRPQEETTTVADLLALVLDDYAVKKRASRTTVGGHVKAWTAALGTEKAPTMTYARLLAVVKQWQAEGTVTDTTINRRLAFLQRAYRLAVRTELLAHVPAFPHLGEHNVRQITWERAEYLAVRAALPDDDLRDLLDWLFLTGMRIGQTLKLMWSAYNRQRGELRSPASDVKTRTEEVIPITGTPLAPIIERRWAARKQHPECVYVFHRRGKRIASFRRSFKSACLAVGITPGRAGKTLHDFRRTGVANLIDSGCDERTAMLISGHKTASMLARYNIRRREAVRRALQQVGDYLARMPAEVTLTSRPSKPRV